MGMCRWMGSHFFDWIDYNGVTFSKELLEWGSTFQDFGVNGSILASYDLGKFQSAHQYYLDYFGTRLVPGILGSVKPGLYSCFDVIERDSLRTPFRPPFPRLLADKEAIKRECFIGTGLLSHQ